MISTQDEVLLEKYEVCPRMFKALVGRGHPEFSSGRQQDALDFFQHLLAVMDRVERSGLAKFAPPGANPTSSIFSFSFEDRFECVESRAVKYIDRTDSFLSVQVPLDQAVNIDEVESQKKRQKIDAAPGEDVKLLVPFSACLESYFAPETVSDFYSTAIGRRGLANKIARFKIFPRYLVVHLKR
jgi:ubiquitin carboxyl-terminal hydrolase 5/13